MSVQDTVGEYIRTELLFDDAGRMPALDEPLLGSGGVIDSFGLQQLLEFIESTFKIEIGDLDIVPENFETLGVLVCFIERKQSGG